VIAWGFYAYLDGPIPPPRSFTTFLFLYVLLAAWTLNLLALRHTRACPLLRPYGGPMAPLEGDRLQVRRRQTTRRQTEHEGVGAAHADRPRDLAPRRYG
jgi:hypothetical protein